MIKEAPMPSAHCPRCGATYHCATTTANGPVCRYCFATGEIVVLLPISRQRLSERPVRRKTQPPRDTERPAPAHPK